MDGNMQAPLSFTVSRSLLKFMYTASVMMLSNHLILCRSLLFLTSIFSQHQISFPMSCLFISGGQSIGASASASVLPVSIQSSGLISFKMDWLDLLAVQRTLKSLLQHHSSKASILWRSVFLMVQRSHPYMTTGKTIALTIPISVNKMMSFPIEGCFYAENPLFSAATFVDYLPSVVWITGCSFSISTCCCFTLHLSVMEMTSCLNSMSLCQLQTCLLQSLPPLSPHRAESQGLALDQVWA